MSKPTARSPIPVDGADCDPADRTVTQRLDRVLLRLRRLLVRPAVTQLPVPAVDRCVDLAKVQACSAIADQNELGHRATVKDVATALDLEHSTVSRLLGECEAELLVIRGSDPVDRRRTTVTLTDNGRAVVAGATATRVSVLGQVLAEWSGADVARLTELLEAFDTTVAERLPTVLAQVRGHTRDD